MSLLAQFERYPLTFGPATFHGYTFFDKDGWSSP
jgi:hypothetical protein